MFGIVGVVVDGVERTLRGVQDGLAELGLSHGLGLAVAVMAAIFAGAAVPATRASQRVQAERQALVGRWFGEQAATAPGNGGDHYLAARGYAKEHAVEQVPYYLRVPQLTAVLWFVALALWSRSDEAVQAEILGIGPAGTAAWRAGFGAIGIVVVVAGLTTVLRLRTMAGPQATQMIRRPAGLIPAVMTAVVAGIVPLIAAWSWAVSIAVTLVGCQIAQAWSRWGRLLGRTPSEDGADDRHSGSTKVGHAS